MQAKPTLDDTLALMRDLRRRCEWDAAQTHESLRPYLIEEAYEVDDAIRAGNDKLDLTDWQESTTPAGLFMKMKKAEGLLEPDEHCYLKELRGQHKNDDVVL